VTIGYEITQDLETDNTLMMVFDMKSSDASKIDVANQSVTQFLRYRKKSEYGKYHYVMCTTKGETSHVDNLTPYLGDISTLSDLDKAPAGASGNDKKFWDNKQADAVSAHGHYFEASADKGANFARIKDNKAEARCIAKLQIPKFNDGSEKFVGSEILGDYDIELGLRIQAAGASATTNVKFANKKALKVKSPAYPDAITAEVKKNSDVHYDRFMDTGFEEFDAYEPFAAGSGAGKPKGQIELIGVNIVNSDPNSVSTVRLTVKSRIPAASLPANAEDNYVYRHTLRLKNKEVFGQDDIVLGCEIDAKNPKRVDVKQFSKGYDLQATDKKFAPGKGELIEAANKIAQMDDDRKQSRLRRPRLEPMTSSRLSVSLQLSTMIASLSSLTFSSTSTMRPSSVFSTSTRRLRSLLSL
jgi:hypothetical protein